MPIFSILPNEKCTLRLTDVSTGVILANHDVVIHTETGWNNVEKVIQ